MSVLRTGSSKKYAEGWEKAFGRKPRSTNRAKTTAKKPKRKKGK